jgi:predicted phage terminase large subunit-like protein
VIEQDRLFNPQSIVIEDRGSGTQLIQDLIGDGISHVARYSPDGDKILRLHAQSAVIENGFVFVPEEAPWLADYLAEHTAFPGGRKNDPRPRFRPTLVQPAPPPRTRFWCESRRRTACW